MLVVQLSINALCGLTPDDMMQVPCHGPQGWTSTQMTCQSQSKRMMTRTSRRLCRSAPLPCICRCCFVAHPQTLERASGQVLAQKLQGQTWILSQLNSSGTLIWADLAPATSAACSCSPCFPGHNRYTVIHTAKMTTSSSLPSLLSLNLCALCSGPLRF